MMDFKQRLEQSRGTTSASELEKNHTCEYFATDNIKSLPACLDLRLPQGERRALPYSYVTEIYFDMEIGIVIYTNTKKVTITGRGLLILYDYLVNYRVRFIQANMGMDSQEEGLFIKDIAIEDL